MNDRSPVGEDSLTPLPKSDILTLSEQRCT